MKASLLFSNSKLALKSIYGNVFRTINCFVFRNSVFILTLKICMLIFVCGNVLGQTTITTWGFEGGNPLPGGNSNPSPTYGSGTTSIIGSMSGGSVATGMNTLSVRAL